MKTIYIIHGWDGSPEADWLPWATKTFKEKGYNVIAPEMPNTGRPEIQPWIQHLKTIVQEVNENVYFIGHSIGCQAIMRFLEGQNNKSGGAIFVAGWFNLINLESEELENIARPWIETKIDTDKVKNNLNYSVAILGTNDQWVPYEETKKEFESRLNSEIVSLEGAGHINSKSSFGPFPKLVEIFENHLK